MSNLESIVPPVELCKQIPAGEFEDSALVWVEDEDGIELVMPREVAQYEHDEMIPAPTLGEILHSPAGLGADFLMREFQIGNKSYCYPTGAEEALRLWFKVKGIEVER